MEDFKKTKEYEEYLEALRAVNKKLENYGEYIPEYYECSRSYLVGLLERLVYDERVMSRGEARRIESLLEGVKTPFELKYSHLSDRV